MYVNPRGQDYPDRRYCENNKNEILFFGTNCTYQRLLGWHAIYGVKSGYYQCGCTKLSNNKRRKKDISTVFYSR